MPAPQPHAHPQHPASPCGTRTLAGVLAQPPRGAALHPHHRRYAGYDYSRGAEFFVTVTTDPRARIFGVVQKAAMELSPLGHLVEHYLLEAASHVQGIFLRTYVVMPDHVHIRFRLEAKLPEPLRTVGAFIGRFKQLSQWYVHQAGGPPHLWERGYHDHICLSREMIDAADRYIANNPLKWWLMHGDRSLLHVREPLDETWLPNTVFWRGVGHFTPEPGQRLVALRISRKVPEALLPDVVRICETGARKGYVYLSTFFSPGEHAVYRAIAERTLAPMVHLRANAVDWAYRPTGREPELFAQRRLMVLARMEATDDPARRADLLWLNDIARETALANGGTAVYVRQDGCGGITFAPP